MFVGARRFGAFEFPPTAQAQNLSQQAQIAQRPVGFADIVEKVKPAVISVRVKVDAAAQMSMQSDSPFQQGSQMDRFFRRFGDAGRHDPTDASATASERGRAVRAIRWRNVTGQGSGFFISADGYAVTNNHVVDKADNVAGHRPTTARPTPPR